MLGKIFCAALNAIDALIVQAEADVSDGLPLFEMVGLLSSEVREAKERVRVAMKNVGYLLPPKRITVNLSPADVRKEGTIFDLPIAIAVLVASGYVQQEHTERILFAGELSLDGRINPVNGVLPIVFEAKQNGFQCCMVPKANQSEACAVDGINILPVSDLSEAVDYLCNKKVDYKNTLSFLETEHKSCNVIEGDNFRAEDDFSSVIGQATVRRAVEVAAAGHHNILMIGPPGAGKTMIAKRIPGILPELNNEEKLELTKIYSVAGQLDRADALIRSRPFRAPHHTVTTAALIGGGRRATPGEISLASKGVLFLDELPEFSRAAIEVLRQPLEEKKITIDRVQFRCAYPADFMLVAAMNPCKCGFFPNRERCNCSENQIRQYRNKLSQPLMDRIDICVEILPVDFQDWFSSERAENSKAIRVRVNKAREIQRARYKGRNFDTNARIPSSLIEEYCPLDIKEKNMMKQVFQRMELSGRGYHRILKVARTIADLDGSVRIQSDHLCEAIRYRSPEAR